MDREKIEQEIRDVLNSEQHAMPFSLKLFSHIGLFVKLAPTLEERLALVQSPLYKEAQNRFRELQLAEAKLPPKTIEEIRHLANQIPFSDNGRTDVEGRVP